MHLTKSIQGKRNRLDSSKTAPLAVRLQMLRDIHDLEALAAGRPTSWDIQLKKL